MADSDITVDGLQAKGGIGQVSLTWNTPVDPHSPVGLPYLQQRAIEVHASETNDRDSAVKIGEVLGSNGFIHAGLTTGQSFHYWIKPRNNSGLYGDWFPLSSTGGVNGVEANFDFLLEENGYFKNSNGLIEQWGQATADEFGSISITFPITFPSLVFNFCPTPLVYPSALPVWVILNTLELTGCSITMYISPPLILEGILPYLPGSGASISWRALGK